MALDERNTTPIVIQIGETSDVHSITIDQQICSLIFDDAIDKVVYGTWQVMLTYGVNIKMKELLLLLQRSD